MEILFASEGQKDCNEKPDPLRQAQGKLGHAQIGQLKIKYYGHAELDSASQVLICFYSAETLKQVQGDSIQSVKQFCNF